MDAFWIITQLVVGFTNGALLAAMIYFMRKAYNDRCAWRAYAALMGIEYGTPGGKMLAKGVPVASGNGTDLYIRGGMIRITSANATSLDIQEY